MFLKVLKRSERAGRNPLRRTGSKLRESDQPPPRSPIADATRSQTWSARHQPRADPAHSLPARSALDQIGHIANKGAHERFSDELATDTCASSDIA